MSKGVAHRGIIALWCAGALVGFAGAAHGQRTPGAVNPETIELRQRDAARLGTIDRRALHLSSGAIRTDGPSEPLVSVMADPARAHRRRVIQLDGPMTPDRRAELEAAGVRLGAALPVDAYFADLSGADPVRVSRLGFVRWSSDIDPAWKVDAGIGTRTMRSERRKAIERQGRVVAVVALHEGAGEAELRETLADLRSAEVMAVTHTAVGTTLFQVALPPAAVPALAELDSVEAIEELPEATHRNSTSRWIVQSNQVNVTPLYANGLTGVGQVLGFLDGLPNAAHCSFADGAVPFGPSHRKIVLYNGAPGTHIHGTHTLCTAVGDSGVFNDMRGVAYGAKVALSQDPSFVSEGFLGPRLQLHNSHGAHVHSNSWGFDGSTAYNAWCHEIDAHSWQYEDDIVIFAVSNLSVVYTPENAKNVLAVAATFDFPDQENVASGGSGPTADGRRKPEIFAPGGNITSAHGGTGCSTLGLTGTSMAAPAVAGVALLMRQYFMEGMYPTGARVPANAFTPSGALLRAMLVNSSANMTGPGLGGYPGDREGWGRILADNALQFPGDARKLLVWDVRNTSGRALATGQQRVHKFQVPNPALGGQLRVTMAFTDAPATIGAAYAPINNVSLEVTSPTGVVYRGNAFGGFESSAGARAEPGSDFDPRNTIEQVHVSNPEAGTWTARIVGEAVNVGTQGYALVVTGGVAAATPCPTDITGDGLVNSVDLAMLLSQWGPAPGNPADFNGDGLVNSFDLPVLLSNWGACP